ncbi:hypothetical protein N9572_03500 [Flavobacteriaceae bacterium]|nr:hypothetical protein [Flavobacteriaceae bacterium]
MKYLFILSFFLFQAAFYNSMGYADLVILLLNLYYLVSNRIKLPKTKYKNLLIVFFCWLLIEPLFLSEFDVGFFVNRILRLVNLFLGVLIIPRVLFRNKNDLFKAIKFLCIICGLLFILTMLEFIMLKLGYNFDLRLINRDIPKVTTKPYSIYSEPSIFAIVLVCSNFIIFSTKKRFNKSKTYFNFFIYINIITILLTFSFSGLAGLLLFVSLSLKIKTNIFIISSIFISSLFINMNDGIFNDNVVVRFDKVINKEDNSANQRLIGSWTVPFLLLDNIYIGSGTGQEIPFLEKFNLTGQDNFSGFNAKINNSLALIFLENGIIGLIIFLLLIFSFYKVHKLLPLLILFYSFSSGSYFAAVIWCVVIIFISLSLIDKQDSANLKLNVRKTIL